MIEVSIENLQRSFGERRVLKGVTARVAGGDRVLVRGPNGSGKSTLLKILVGLLSPTGGRVVYRKEGRELDIAGRRAAVGYLAPDLVLYDELTPLENLDFFSRVRELPGGAPNRALLDRVGLGKRVADPLGTLSTGLKQRMKVAFALQNEPSFLFLDEPGSNLDDAGRDLIRQVIEDRDGGERIVFIATNDPAEFGYGTTSIELG